MAALELNSTRLIRDTGLVAYWRFQGNSNATVGGFNGSDTNASYSNTYGKFGNGVSCTGTADANIAFSAKIIPAGAKTISFWYTYLGTTTNLQHIVDTCQQDPATKNGTYITTSTNGQSIYWGEGINVGSLTLTAPNNGSNFYTFTWDGTTGTNKMIGYINGAISVQATAATATQAAGYRNLCVAGLSGYSYPLKGYLDELAIFNRALNPKDVWSLYSGVWTGGSFLLNML